MWRASPSGALESVPAAAFLCVLWKGFHFFLIWMEGRQTPAQKGEHVLDAAPKTNAINLAGRGGDAEMKLTTAAGAPATAALCLIKRLFVNPSTLFTAQKDKVSVASVRTGRLFGI